MVTYSIKKEKDRIVVKASLPGLPPRAVDAAKVRASVRQKDVRKYVESQGIKIYECLESNAISNYAGDPKTGIFIYSLVNPAKSTNVPKSQEKPLKSGINVEKVIKDLTPVEEPVIIEEQPKKRKRVKRVSKTGNQTTS